jgi:glycerophosphoryl diester phosphodiesterase
MSMRMRYQLRGREARCKSPGSNVASGVRATAFSLLLLAATFVSTGCCIRPSMVDIGPLEEQPALDLITVAHRGNINRGAIPDNSLPALRHALDAGVQFLEVDVRRSTDGTLFLFHDGSLSRSNSYAPSHLRGIPIGQLSSANRNVVRLDSAGQVEIPSLADALSLLKQSRSSHTTLQLDLKGESDTLALEVLGLAQSYGMLNRVLVQLRTPERVALVLSNYPHARVLARCKSHAQLEQALKYRVEAVELERWITSDAVRLAHSRSVRVAINIAGSRLDEPSTHEYFRTRGVDMIMSDRAAESAMSERDSSRC